MAQGRTVMRLQLTKKAAKVVKTVSDQTGITQIALATSLVEWFASQPEEIRAAVLKLYPESIKTNVAKLILTRMADAA